MHVIKYNKMNHKVEYKVISETSGSYLFRGPSDQTVGLSASFTIETNGISLTEWAILARRTPQIGHNKYDPRAVCFQW